MRAIYIAGVLFLNNLNPTNLKWKMCKFTTDDGKQITGRTNQYLGLLFNTEELEILLFKVVDMEKLECKTHTDEQYRYVKLEIVATSDMLPPNPKHLGTKVHRLEEVQKYYFGMKIDGNPEDFLGKLVQLKQERARNESTSIVMYEAAQNIKEFKEQNLPMEEVKVDA